MDENKKVPATSEPKNSFAKDIASYVWEDTVQPKMEGIVHDALGGIVDMIASGVMKGIDSVFTQNGRGNRYSSYSSRSNSNERTNYNVISSGRSYSAPAYSRSQNIGSRSSLEVRYIWVKSEEEARFIIRHLQNLIDRFGAARVSDLYESVTPTIRTSPTDSTYGWVNVNDLSYTRERSGEHQGEYFLDLPRPIDIRGYIR